MAVSQSTLEIIIQAVDEASEEFENISNGLDSTGQHALTAQQQLQAYGQALETAGLQLTIAGAAIDAFYGEIVSSAASTQESQDSLTQSVTDIVGAANSAGSSSSSYAVQVAFLKDKIDAANASIAVANAALTKNTGTTVEVAAAHEQAAADIATDQANVDKYTQSLDLLTAAQGLVGASTSEIVAQFENAARANTDLGFSITDSEASLQALFAATQSVPNAMEAYQTAMDLARAKNEDLSTATQQVTMALQGQGRGLISIGVNIKDGLSGMQALAAVQAVVGGQAQAYSDTLSGQMAAALQNLNKLFSDMGTTQLPILEDIFEALNKVITAVDNWTNAHPKLTEALLVFIGVLGVMLTILGTLMLAAGAVALALASGLSAAFIGIAAAVAVGVAAIAALAVAIVSNWDYIRDNMTAAMQLIQAALGQWWTWIKDLFHSALSDVQGVWNSAWQSMSDFLSNIWTTVTNTVRSGINTIISAINGFINALDSLHISIPPITIPGTKLGTPAVDLGFNIPDIPMLAAGGVVYNPVLAMIGEQGPEAVVPLSSLGTGGIGGVGSNQQQIVININGGIFPADQSAIKQIGDMLAKSILQQIRVKNYAL